MTGLVVKFGCLLALFSVISAASLNDSNEDFGDEFDVETTTTLEVMQETTSSGDNAAAANNSSMRCWSCSARYRSWADCQNLDEIEYCENPDETSCYRSSIKIEGLLGKETRYHRLAGCAMNKTALQEAYMEHFEITFGDESNGKLVTLEEFTVCNGSLCNVLDEEALRVGKWRVVHGNLAGSGGGIFPVGSIVGVLVGSVLAVIFV